MTEDAARELARYFKAGARLRSELSPFEADQALVSEGGTVLYAIDTNVVWLFLNPRGLGPKHEYVGGYTHVFPDDQDHVAEALGAALSRFILYHLNKGIGDRGGHPLPLLLLDGHDAEVRWTYDRLLVDVHQRSEIARDDVAALREGLAWLAEPTELAEQVSRVRDSAQRIIEWLYLDDSEPAQANRLGRLLSDGRLARLPTALDRVAAAIGGDRTQVVRDAFANPHDLLSQMRESQSRAAWERRLRDFNVHRKRQSLQVDAMALAKLEVINESLRDHAIRVCLITADNAMINAASAFRLETSGESFAEAYIRHPRAFLAADEVLTPASTARRRDADHLGLVSNWLDTLLARFTDDQGPSKADLLRIAEGDESELVQRAASVLSTDEGALTTLKDQWTAHTGAIRNEHAASSNLAQEEIRRIIGATAFADMQESLDAIQAVLSDASDLTWDSYYRAVVRTGFDLVQTGERRSGGRRRRNAPAIDFESFSHARDFVRRVVAARGLSELAPGEIDERLREIEAQGGGYATLLAYAALFADAGRWHVALLTAKRAISVARLYQQGRSLSVGAEPVSAEIRRRVSGREGYFFAAVAQRLTARSPADLDKSEALLVKARHALGQDRRRHDAPTHSDLRFDAEELAGKLTRYLFKRFGHPVEPALRDDLVALREEAARLGHEAMALKDEWTRRLVERSSLTNLFMIVALQGDASGAIEADPGLASAAARLTEIMAADATSVRQELPVTELVAIVGMYAEARFGSPDRHRRRRIRDELAVFANDVRTDRPGLMMPYDHDRYMYLVDAALAAL